MWRFHGWGFAVVGILRVAVLVYALMLVTRLVRAVEKLAAKGETKAT
jgi:hypothetical protein